MHHIASYYVVLDMLQLAPTVHFSPNELHVTNDARLYLSPWLLVDANMSLI